MSALPKGFLDFCLVRELQTLCSWGSSTSAAWQQEGGALWLDSLVPVHALGWNLTRKIVSVKKVLPF